MKLNALVVALATAGLAASALAAKGPAPKQQFLAIKAEMAAAKVEMTGAKTATPTAAPGVSAADVGDADSFGRYAKYLGLVNSGVVTLADDCTPDPSAPPGPDDRCITLNPQPALTTFTVTDIGRMTIPGKSSNSLFCHWQTPLAITQWQNVSGAFIPNARVAYTPTYTFENPVLNDPSLVDPVTGLPLGGKIEVSLPGIRHQQSMQPGDIKLERDNESRTCIAGMISAIQLRGYGLTDQQIAKFFQNDTKVTMGLTGQASGVVFGSIIVGTRFMGD